MGLNYSAVSKHFPESDDTWKEHGREIKSGLTSTKQALAEEKDSGATKPKLHSVFTKVYDLHDDL